MNRVYMDALRRADEEMAKQEGVIAQLTRRTRELEAVAPAKEDNVLGVRPAVFMKEMEIIQRDTGKGLRAAFALWQEHREACAVTKGKEEVANASREGLRDWLSNWAEEGFAQHVDHLCDCGEVGCPTDEMEYVEGRGFVNRWTLSDERAAAAEVVAQAKMLERMRILLEQEKAARAAEEEKPLSWADRVRKGSR